MKCLKRIAKVVSDLFSTIDGTQRRGQTKMEAKLGGAHTEKQSIAQEQQKLKTIKLGKPINTLLIVSNIKIVIIYFE
jgi:hypothetical protein